MKNIHTLLALIWGIGVCSLYAQTNDTMYVHMGQTVIKHAIKDVDSITFYLAEKEDPFLIVDETPITVPAEGGKFSISVKSNTAWTVVESGGNWGMSGNTWFRLNNKEGNGDDTVTINIFRNTFYTTRSVVITTIYAGDLTKSVVITQEAATEPDKNDACGSYENPQEKLPWLKELIERAKNDKTGNLSGWIWFVNYKGKDIFVTDMNLGSGSVRYWYFDCAGNHFVPKFETYCIACPHVGNHHVFFQDVYPSGISTVEVSSLIRSGEATLIYSGH